MILESDFPPNVRLEKELRTLVNTGHKIILLCSSPESQNEIITWNEATIIKNKMPRFIYKSSVGCLEYPFYFNYWRKLLKSVFDKHKFDVIHLYDLPLVKIVKEFSVKHKIPLVLDLPENRPEIMKHYHHIRTFPGNMIVSLKRWHKYQEKYTKVVDKLILITDEAKNDYLIKYNLDPQKIAVISNFVDIEDLNSIKFDCNILNNYCDKFVVSYFGDTGLRRGTATIIQAANLLERYKDIHFLIIGKSKEDGILKKMIKDLNLSNVKLLGWIPFNKAVSYIKLSKIGLCPFLRNIHHDTTYANKMFQYMFYGKPIIASDCTSQKIFVENEKCGSVFEAGNAGELAKKIIDMKLNPKYNELSKNAAKVIINKYNWQNASKVLIDMYNEISEQ